MTDPSKGERPGTQNMYTAQGNAKVGILGPDAVIQNLVFDQAADGTRTPGDEDDGPHPDVADTDDSRGIARPKKRGSWDRNLTNLRDVLAALYPTVQDAITVVDAAEL